MNIQEREMLEILKLGREKFYFAGIKAEFEAEGTRSDEMHRLVELTRKSGLNLGIKIGGCEAVSDLYKTKLLGAEYIIAPMVETAYSLKKYIDAKNKVYSSEERKDVRFLFNLETITAFNNLDSIIDVAKTKDGADGIVFGRVDFVGSMGFGREKISNGEIVPYINKASELCKKNNLDFVIGGAISNETIDSVIEANKIYLSRFETRKIIFDAKAFTMNDSNLNKALELAVKFELLWLQNKQNYYSAIANEDSSRISMLSKRFENF